MNPTTTFILNRILSIFNLEWTEVGLRYVHKLKFGEVSYHITSDLDKVIKFLGLPFKPTDDIEKLYYCIVHSSYFTNRVFTNLRPDDKAYCEFLFKLREDKPVNARLKRNDLKLTRTEFIDHSFGSNITPKIKLLNSNGLNAKELRNKFNGKLVMKWSDESPGSSLASTMEEFKIHVENTFNQGFTEYLATRKPKTIRADFQSYYYELDYILAD